jgi:hypothetical protein
MSITESIVIIVVVVIVTVITTTNMDIVIVTGIPIDQEMVTMEDNICMVEDIMDIIVTVITIMMVMTFKLLFVDLWNLKIG